MKFFVKDFFSNCDQISGKLQIWSHLSLHKNMMFSIKDFSSKCDQSFLRTFSQLLKKFFIENLHFLCSETPWQVHSTILNKSLD